VGRRKKTFRDEHKRARSSFEGVAGIKKRTTTTVKLFARQFHVASRYERDTNRVVAESHSSAYVFVLRHTSSQANKTGAVARPSFKSAALGLPSSSAEATKSSISSTIWKAMPRFRPYWNVASTSASLQELSMAA